MFRVQCAGCHGLDGVGGPFGDLVGREPREGFPFATRGGVTTIGNYWPYATTVFEYIRRAMPYQSPGVLSDDEVYALTAYLLYRNEIVPRDVVLDAQSLAAVQMPARERFVRDDREGGPNVR